MLRLENESKNGELSWKSCSNFFDVQKYEQYIVQLVILYTYDCHYIQVPYPIQQTH